MRFRHIAKRNTEALIAIASSEEERAELVDEIGKVVKRKKSKRAGGPARDDRIVHACDELIRMLKRTWRMIYGDEKPSWSDCARRAGLDDWCTRERPHKFTPHSIIRRMTGDGTKRTKPTTLAYEIVGKLPGIGLSHRSVKDIYNKKKKRP